MPPVLPASIPESILSRIGGLAVLIPVVGVTVLREEIASPTYARDFPLKLARRTSEAPQSVAASADA